MNLTRFAGSSSSLLRGLTSSQAQLPYVRLSYSTTSTPPAEVENVQETPAPKKRKSRKTTKSFLDLPTVYVNSAGKPAVPLEEFIPGLLTNFQPEPAAIAKPILKARASRKQPDNAKNTGTENLVTPSITRKTPQILKHQKPPTFLSQQILANLRRLPHCLLLTRVGQFYESYFDQAVEISRLLHIKLTSRKWNGERVAMCGFPLMHLDKHLKTLVQQEKRFVAMCEEFPISTAANIKEFDRRIARIITPGTLIDESFLDPFQNNYILAIAPSGTSDSLSKTLGLAWMDVSTGQFYSKQCVLENLQDELARVNPQEVILPASFRAATKHPLLSTLKDNGCTTSFFSVETPSVPDESDTLQSTEECSVSPLPESMDSGTVLNPRSLSEETSAIQLLTSFLQANLLEHMPILNNPIHETSQQLMQIDSHTIQGLEIRENDYETGVKGSLLSVVKRTSTSGGTRLLSRWICAPSTSRDEIIARQSLVTIFRQRAHFRADVSELLKELDDVERLCQRFMLGKAEFSDLASIKTAIERWDDIQKRVEHEKQMESIENPSSFREDDWSSIDTLFARMLRIDKLCSKISSAITRISEVSSDMDVDDSLPNTENVDSMDVTTDKSNGSKWAINPNYSEKVQKLYATKEKLQQEKDQMQNELCLKYSSSSLSLRCSPGNGFIIHLARARRDKRKLDGDPDFHSIGETLNTKSYFYRPWAHLGNSIAETSSAIASAEKDIFQNLRLEVIRNVHLLRQNAQIIDELDVALSFSILAAEMNFVRPEITDDGSYCVINGRHPTVEIGLLSSGRQFIPNSVDMTKDSNMHIITGPNMAGKSTLLRQTALISILAQVGSFVPADFARIGIVDKVFSRIGARDDLFRDRSTFMVEMLETADILRRATEKSLVIMDEVGRGTTVKDGLAIAFGALHHLATVNKSRCLFATHYHELADMVGNIDDLQGTGIFQNIRFYCSDVDDARDGHFAYAYRLRPGINRDSHGLKVAALAGMPPAAIAIATKTLAQLKGTEPNESIMKPTYTLTIP